jgi:tetratricopeptide (TPR) repeat protein
MASIVQAKLTQEEAYQLASDAQMAFRQGNEQVQYDAAAAKNFYDQAILRYQKIMEEGGIANEYLYYNIGNVYLLKGDIGRAILHYKRAEKTGGTNTNLEQNLSFARSKRLDQVPVKAEKRVMHTLFFWHYDFGLKTRFLIACSFWVLLWLAAILWFLSSRWRFTRWFALAVGLITICLAVSIFMETYNTYQNPQGVIVAESVIARQGDGENYAESFKQPLHAGTEFDLLEKRSDWLRIRLANDAETWISSQSAEII